MTDDVNKQPLSKFQQQNIITMLAHSDQHGAIIAAMVDPDLFSGDYRPIAHACIKYWKDYKQAPKAHTPDLLETLLTEQGRRGSNIRRILEQMYSLAQTGINETYVMNTVMGFIRVRQAMEAINKGAALINNGDANLEQLTEIMRSITKAQHDLFTPAFSLDEELEPFLDWLATSRSEFPLGIKVLDNAGIGPQRKQLLLMIGGKGRGKSWFLINTATHAIMCHKKVLYLSLEMDEMEMRQRFFQSFFSIPERISNPMMRASFKRQGDEVVGIQEQSLHCHFDFADPDLRTELETRMLTYGARLRNLRIKPFPNRTVTISVLESYLDWLQDTEDYQPDMLVIDYAKLMKLEGRTKDDHRLALSRNTEELRRIARERNLALVTADQLNREGFQAKQARSYHVGEDWSQTHTADTVLTHSTTEAEFERGLARLFVDHARGAKDKFGCLIISNYAVGQFCLDSAMMPNDYYERIMPTSGDQETIEAEEETADA